MPYETPQALRAALEDRLRNQAAKTGVDLQRLRRRAVVERLLVRLESAAPGRWILKGGMAVEFRLHDRARATRDLDLALRGQLADSEDVRDLLIESLATDPDHDGFAFAVSPPTPLQVDEAGRPGWRFTVEAGLAGRQFAAIRLDVVARREEITGTERLSLPGTLAFAGMPTRDVEVVDRRQHFAEKLHALTRVYRDRPSSRVRDLPDLMLLIEDGLVADSHLVARVRHVFDVRGTHSVPDGIPDPSGDWERAYAALADDLDITAKSLERAMEVLRDFWATALAEQDSSGG
ncbi:MAG TPA: nucleotidyl transferase AbiEii/AbiGii toxin family protein [Acidimicrobiales bacterium]|nr:nucleotidyl transferase AbiEii/AbiGii toxin family protein [Acidimicrobiales bacterium]